MEKIKNLSIRKSIIFYMSVSLVVSFFLSAVIRYAAESTQQGIWRKYAGDDYYEAAVSEGNYTVEIQRPDRDDMTAMDWHISEVCDILETWSVLIISVFGCVIAVFIFYKHKIAIPLDILEDSSKMIAHNELDFTVEYDRDDEMGRLCAEFERMRKQLAQNNKELWKMVEQEKELRAAIAHDIRSPLAVLEGYQEMLLEFIPSDTLDKEKVVEMLSAGMKQIEYLKHFMETMRRISKLEDREVQCQDVDLSGFVQNVRKKAEILGAAEDKDCKVTEPLEDYQLRFDPDIVSEVIDNLAANALRFADKRVAIEFEVDGDNLIVSVMDDGAGFKESEDTVTKAYYHANPQDDLNHFGMGLYISRVYCERHGGRLLIRNQRTGGALVKAVFKTDRLGLSVNTDF